MAKPNPHDSNYEHEANLPTEDEATTARMDLPSAYTMHGRLQLDGCWRTRQASRGGRAHRRAARARGRWLLLQGAQRENRRAA
jgi:hypothetical protein